MAASPQPAKARRAAKPIDEQRPAAPWGDVPLVELVVLAGIVMLVLGFFFFEGETGTTLIATGLVIASLAGLELSIREHFAGFRSHTTLLAGVAGIATLLVLYYAAGLTPGVSLAGAAAAFALAFALLARAFRSRSGRLVKLR